MRAAACLALAACLAAADPLAPEPSGAFTYAGIRFALLLQGPDAVATSQAVHPDPGWPRHDGAGWETRGSVILGDGAAVALRERLVRRDDGGCDLELHLDSPRPLPLQTAALVAELPAAAYAGRGLAYNGGTEALPREPGEAMLGRHWKSGIAAIALPLDGRELVLRGELDSAVADERAWGQPRFGLRLLCRRPQPDSLTSASLRCSLGLADAAPAGTPVAPAPTVPAEPGAVALPPELAPWELPPGWAARVAVVPEGTDGAPCLRVDTTMRAWGYQPTRQLAYPRDIARVVFAGRMRVQDVVPGSERWQQARAQLRFLGGDGEQVGPWPPTTDMSGTRPWTAFRQEHACPGGARTIELWLGMAVASGTAWYEGLSLAAYDAAGQAMQPLAVPRVRRTDTAGWWPFAPGAEDPSRPLAIDFAAWLPTPAGSAGRVVVRDGHLAFERGGRARFWGSGAAPWCPAEADSPRIVANLRRAGINLVRFHGMDAMDRAQSIFDPASERTDRLDPAKLDRLDRHVANLRAAGIYLDLNLLTKRRFLPGDGVAEADQLPEGGKEAALFDPRLIALQRDYARLLLTHVNPYTGLAYKDDPAVAMVEIVNETSLFSIGSMGRPLPPSYVAELDALFAAWCAANAVPRPEGGVVALLARRPVPAAAARFAAGVEEDYYRGMRRFLVEEVGLRAPLIGTSYASESGEKAVQAGLGIIDAHAYHDHPAGGWSPTSRFTGRALVRSSDNLVARLALERVAGLPFTVSEWNCVWANPWIAEGPPLVAAYAGFQDWDAAMAFALDGSGWAPRMDGCFVNDNKPHLMAAAVAAALAFHRGDVAPGPLHRLALAAIPPGATAHGHLAGLGRNAELAPLAERFALDREAVADPPFAGRDGPFASRDGQVRWDLGQGLVVVDSPATQAVVGFAGAGPIATRDLRFELSTPFAQVQAVSLDGAPLASARRLLIAASARAENSGQTYRVSGNGLADPGHGPILLEPVRAGITLRRPGAAAPTVNVLDWYGRRTGRTLPATAVADGWSVALGQEPAAWFEVVWP